MECLHSECRSNVSGTCGVGYDDESLLTYDEAQDLFDECLNPDFQIRYLPILLGLIVEHYNELRRDINTNLKFFQNERVIVNYMKGEFGDYILPGSHVLNELFKESHTPISPDLTEINT